MTINHSDKGWWKAFSEATKRAFRRNDLKMKAHLYELYERQMRQRRKREYYYSKQQEYNALKAKGMIGKRFGFFDWLKTESV